MYDKIVERLQRRGLTFEQFQEALLAVVCATHDYPEAYETVSAAYYLLESCVQKHAAAICAYSADSVEEFHEYFNSAPLPEAPAL